MHWRFFPILIIYLGIQFYFWRRLIKRNQLSVLGHRIAFGALLLAAIGTPLVMVLARFSVLPSPAWIMPVFFWMGFGLYLLMGLLLTDLLRVGLRLYARFKPESWSARNLASRKFNRGLTLLAMSFALCTSSLGFISARCGPTVRTLEIELNKLPQDLDGLRIVQISDLHAGQTIGRAYVQSVSDQVVQLKPDLIVITGDLVDGHPDHIGDRLTPLLELQATYGIHYVTGNHEYYSGVEPWLVFLRAKGINVLDNRRVSIGSPEASFDLVGVNDSGFGADLDRALAGRDPSRAVILLAHRPRDIHGAARHKLDLQLSGHTHGGQLWPGQHIAPLLFPYVHGLHTHQGTKIYVSRGTGYVGPPLRLGAPSEITLITLRAAGST